MKVLISNQTGFYAGYLFGRFPGLLGHLYSPGGERGPWSFVDYALDNGAFGAFQKGTDFDYVAWMSLLTWSASSSQKPMWAAVPDVVGDWKGTLRLWGLYQNIVRKHGITPALVLQDGCSEFSIPDDADVVFVGGSTDWKWENLHRWCQLGKRVHVGRVNSPSRLYECQSLGVDSVDGTGWFRGDENQTRGLVRWLEENSDQAISNSITAMPNRKTAANDNLKQLEMFG